MATDGRRDAGGIVVAAVFIFLGGLAIWDSLDYADADSYVFPRTIAGAMIVFSLALIAWNLARPVAPEPAPPGSTPRRVGLVVAMLAAALSMPYTGFLIAGLGAFAAITAVAMYDPWTRGRLLLYPLVGTAIVFGFYVLFTRVLLVPLPVGKFFQ